MKLHAPLARCGDGHATPNTLGIRRVTFAVDDIDAAVAGLQARGAELLGRVVRHEDSHRLCYVGGPEGIIVMLAEQNRLRPPAGRQRPADRRQSSLLGGGFRHNCPPRARRWSRASCRAVGAARVRLMMERCPTSRGR